MSYLEFCSNCGEKNIYGQIDGGIRYHCLNCKNIHYENPKPTSTSFHCDVGKLDNVANKRAYKVSKQVASLAIESYNAIKTKGLDITEGARYYHTYEVSPRWSKVYPVVGRIGDHIFYK